MITFHRMSLLVLLGLLLVFMGCTKPYKITHDLEAPIRPPSACTIGEITDGLPFDTKDEDKPTIEHIDMFRGYLEEELSKKEIFGTVGDLSADAQYRVEGTILEFKKGSGFVRFMIGFGLGSAILTVELRLIETESGITLFAGNFKRKISDWGESGDKTFENVAKDFAKELKKQLKKLNKG
ncbi:MAG: DUF4410 domain-containing protein [candidate division Zixibacteria bacterium]|nr:DUF4410 domain-containing protein [candidate division Zixibacteria bacterium]